MTTIFAAMHTNSQATPMRYGFLFPNGLKFGVKRSATLGLVLLLSACQTVVPRAGTAPAATASSTPLIVPPDGRHRIAVLLPITGPDGDIGRSLANANAMALIDTKMTNLNVQTYDTALGLADATKRALADGNMLILGPLRSDNVIEVAELAQARKVPIISFSNDVGVAGRNAFLLGHLPNQSVQRIVDFSKSKGLTRFAAIVPKNVYGQRAASNLNTAIRNSGAVLVGIQEVDGSAASLTAATQKLKASGQIDAILIAESGKSAIAAVSAIRSAGMNNTRILGTELWNIDASLSSSTAMRGAWFASVSDGFYRQYAAKYRARYNKTPLRLSSLGYDSILLVGKVTPNWKLGSTFPLAQLTDKGGFIGLDGAFRFNANGMSERMLEVQEIQAGKFVTIDAAPKAFAN
jgi:branched-chain amino acid transport system substrate-binding protein